MKENKNKKQVIRLKENSPSGEGHQIQELMESKREPLKRPLIFSLMAVVFAGCMYLIFTPDTEEKKVDNYGLNDTVPQATNAVMPDDKGKAYEQDILRRKTLEKREKLTSLSDYWDMESQKEETAAISEELPKTKGYGSSPSLNSYRRAQTTLGTFYSQENPQTEALRSEVEDLKAQLAEKEATPADAVETQLALMEKSYQMAAKYLPANPNTTTPPVAEAATSENEHVVPLSIVKKNRVSSLNREPSDSTLVAYWSKERNKGFHTTGATPNDSHPKNSIKACVHQGQTITGETTVRLRLLESAQTPKRIIPKGTVLTALAKPQSGRLQLKVSSIELKGNIIPVAITIYDLDGQPGLYVPYSAEMNALSEMTANMSQSSTSGFTVNTSPESQLTADLSRGVIQGISGYFSKKVRTPKITLKAGHQLLLVSKE
ncbi:conjugative transposon protein TraM [Flavobacterium sp.]|uniref:conjugative transposon protein TraM n=1 Tax=Flavobacterium sp. TaxID=239 RepID=UPI003A91282C